MNCITRSQNTYPHSPSELLGNGPRIQGLDYHGRRRAYENGGDFFDFISRPASNLVLCMGAVSAQTCDTAQIASSLENIMCSLSAEPLSTPASIARELNRFVCCAPDESAYAPFFYACLDPLRRELCYVNAGHEPALLLRKRQNRAIRLESNGAVLGLTNRSRYGQRSLPLETGDLLAIFSEGVAETVDIQGNPFGSEGVVRALKRRQPATAVDLVEEILDAAERHAGWAIPTADHTAAVIRFAGAMDAFLPAEEGAELAFAAA